MRQTGSSPGNEVFTSWKEIASYLHKGVRTVQRWEAQFGLPIRRPVEKAKGVVQATREDLDRWLASKWAVRAQLAEPENENGPSEIGYKDFGGFRTVTLVGSSSIERAHHLRTSNRKLVSELEESLQRLCKECETLSANLQVHGKLETPPEAIESPERYFEKGTAT